MSKLRLGQIGENLALTYLKKQGYKLISQNWRCQYGEIDLVMKKDNTVVFMEVKTRRSLNFGPPETAITHEKIRKIIKTAQCYLQSHPNSEESWRVDVIAIKLDPKQNKPGVIKHIPNITL